MPIDFPSNLLVSNVEISHYTPNYYNEGMSLISSSLDRGIHRLTGSFDVHITSQTDQMAFEAFLMKIRGRLNPFYINLGGRFNTPITGVTLSGIHGINVSTLDLGIFSGTIQAGSMFTLVNDDKVYMALDDRTGTGSVDIYPSLRLAQADAAALNFGNVKILVRLNEDAQFIQYSEAGLIHMITVNFKEDL